ncbi:hypothetical protein ACSBR2_016222 [Camellia fascicularis]
MIQELYEKRGRKFGSLCLSPLGCLPALRAANPKGNEGGCFEEACALALAHNNALKAVLTSLEHLFKGFKYCNSNFYGWFEDKINNPSKYGFKEGMNACCGTGPFRDDYVWWDSFHPTERIHEQFAKALWDGPLDFVGPYNLLQLFFFNKLTIIADLVDDPESDTQCYP